MKVLLIGSGGREHALAWKFTQSPKLTELFVAPGNPGIAKLPKTKTVSIPSENIEDLLRFAQEENIDFTFVGPEKPLALGIVNLFRKNNKSIFGPDAASAQLEASKQFAKEIMIEAEVPTATYEVFDSLEATQAYLNKCKYPIVLKADGLAAGKGVAVCTTKQLAIEFADQIFVSKVFGESGNRVVVEEFLEGRECSVLAICDGNTYQLLSSAQDHKRLLDGDFGPNTGGMGAYSPSPIFDETLEQTVHEHVFQPILHTLQRRGIRYTGILYAGLMITKDGPKVLEFNARFGDPETQVILPRLQNDLLEVMVDAAEGHLDKHELHWADQACLTVVLAAKGYPEQVQKGQVISGLPSPGQSSIVFHAGTAAQGEKIVTAGGRVLTVTALGKNMDDARETAYQQISQIKFDGMQFRKDIGETI
ncbi:MAG: phosphoribosylamine--glycine ligase [Proteobacteria bacterium]|jgi:phosphoribosylamine--glycine ligase|nr:phosphoribosylamine--glycine ligase [Pseudomonadota bacterium]